MRDIECKTEEKWNDSNANSDVVFQKENGNGSEGSSSDNNNDIENNDDTNQMNEPSNKTKKESLQKSVISVMCTRWRKKVP